MVTTTFPGVYVEEQKKRDTPTVVAGPAALALVGYTKQGPVATPKEGRITSWSSFLEKFGGFTGTSLVPTTAYAYFLNGGSAVVVTRVLGASNAKATSKIKEDVADELATLSSSPTGARGLVTANDHSGAGLRQFAVNLSRDPQTTDTITIKFWAIGTPKPSASTFEGTQTAGNPATVGPFTFTPGAAGYNTGASTSQQRLEPGSVEVQIAGATVVYDKGDGTFLAGGNLSLADSSIDYDTGAVTIKFSVAPANDATLKIRYRRIVDRVEKAFTISSAGVFADVDAGALDANPATAHSINRTTGAIVFTTGTGLFVPDATPIAGKYTAVSDGYNWDAVGEAGEAISKVEIDYTEEFWALTAVHTGAWGNKLRTKLSGDEDFFAAATQSYSRHVLQIEQQDDDGVWQFRERFRNLNFAPDPTPGDNTSGDEPTRWAPHVVNDTAEGSKYVRLGVTGDGSPTALNGKQIADEPNLATGADAVVTLTDKAVTKATTIGPKTLSITFKDGAGNTGATHTIVDDGLGNLVGSDPGGVTTLDSSGTNKVVYATGKISLKTAVVVPTGNGVAVTYYSQPASSLLTFTFSGGSDGSALTRSDVTAPALEATKAGMYALNDVEDNLDLAIPDFAGNETVAGDQLTWAATRNNVCALLTTPKGYTPAQARDYRILVLAADSSYGALYYPWVLIKDPLAEVTKAVPPLGHVAGIMARTDKTRNVGKNPAGKPDGTLAFSLGVETELSMADVGSLDPAGVNCIVDLAETGRSVWGCNTLIRDRQSELRFVNARRGTNYVKVALFKGFWSKVFENNDPALWASLQRQAASLLDGYFKQGFFKGASAAEAYQVICDSSNNTTQTVAAGQVVCDVAVAFNKPGLYVVFRVSQKAGLV